MKKSTFKLVAASIFTISLAVALAVFAFACYQKIQTRDVLSADLLSSVQESSRSNQKKLTDESTNLESIVGSSRVDDATTQNDLRTESVEKLPGSRRDASSPVTSRTARDSIKPLSDPRPANSSNDSSQNFKSDYFDDVAAAPISPTTPDSRSGKTKTKTGSKTDSKPAPETDLKAEPETNSKTESESATDTKPKNAGRRVKSPDAIFGKPIVDSIRGKCVSCSDGDTLTILVGEETFRVRLASVDCPESAQAYGQKAKQALSQMVHGKDVIVHATGKDDYGRTLAFVIVRRINVAERLIKTGMGWHYSHYSDSVELSRLQEKARKSEVGLWADKNPTPPWDWRRAESSKKRR